MAISLVPESVETPQTPVPVERIEIDAIHPPGSVQIIEEANPPVRNGPIYLRASGTVTSTPLLLTGESSASDLITQAYTTTSTGITENSATIINAIYQWDRDRYRFHRQAHFHGPATGCDYCTYAEADAQWTRLVISNLKEWAVFPADSEIVGEAIVARDPLRGLRTEFPQQAEESKETWDARLTIVKQTREQQAREEFNRRRTEYEEQERLRHIRYQNARQKARSLLLSILTDDQVETMERHGYVEVVSRQTRTRFKVYTDQGHHGNIVQLDDKGEAAFNWCVAPGGDGMILPHEDRIAGQILMLTHCEAELRLKANVTQIRYRRPNAA